jgi:hypothetical protein
MKRTLIRQSILIALSFVTCLAQISKADHFDYMVQLPEIKSKGFHKIIIAPAISAKSAANLSDLRLYDEQKKEIPYIQRKDFISKQHRTFTEHKVISEQSVQKSATEIVIKNQAGKPINNLSVFLNNAEVCKEIIISGSYDQKEWYAVNTIYFPLSDYTYFKIRINDKYSLPVKVLKVGYYSDSLRYGDELILPNPQINRTEQHHEHITRLQLNFDAAYNIDKLNLKVSSPTLYRRNVRVFALRNSGQKNEKILLQQTTLTPASSSQIILENVFEKQLCLEIDNDNNPLLVIDSIICSQRSQYIIAFIEKPGIYGLKFANKALSLPVYDLSYFNQLIPAEMPVIETEKLKMIYHPTQPVNRTVQPFFYNKKFFLWTVIVVVALLLLLVSSKMLNEKGINKK